MSADSVMPQVDTYRPFLMERPIVQRSSIPVTKKTIEDTLLSSLSSPYLGEADEDGNFSAFDMRYIGRCVLEVLADRLAQKAASGDLKAIDMVLDRTVGKPKQAIESTNLSMTYKDYLDSLEPLDGDEPQSPDEGRQDYYDIPSRNTSPLTPLDYSILDDL